MKEEYESSLIKECDEIAKAYGFKGTLSPEILEEYGESSGFYACIYPSAKGVLIKFGRTEDISQRAEQHWKGKNAATVLFAPMPFKNAGLVEQAVKKRIEDIGQMFYFTYETEIAYATLEVRQIIEKAIEEMKPSPDLLLDCSYYYTNVTVKDQLDTWCPEAQLEKLLGMDKAYGIQLHDIVLKNMTYQFPNEKGEYRNKGMTVGDVCRWIAKIVPPCKTALPTLKPNGVNTIDTSRHKFEMYVSV